MADCAATFRYTESTSLPDMLANTFRYLALADRIAASQGMTRSKQLNQLLLGHRIIVIKHRNQPL
jgi:hypothetical protein